MEKEYALGIDIGGTGTAIGIVDREGNIVARGSLPSRGHRDFGQYAAKLYETATSVAAGRRLAGVGVGAPAVDGNGVIVGGADLPWPSPIPLSQILGELFGLPVRAANDANAAAMGEMMYGAARGLTDFIEITLGTGVGSGIVCDGHLLLGAHGLAGELGHVIVEDGGRECSCGRRGCLETYCAAKGIVRSYREFSGKADIEITPAEICELARKGDRAAKDSFALAGHELGKACANFAAFSSPRAIVLFGGITQAGELLFGPMRKAFDENLLFIYRDQIEILTSGLPASDAALLGASALAWG